MASFDRLEILILSASTIGFMVIFFTLKSIFARRDLNRRVRVASQSQQIARVAKPKKLEDRGPLFTDKDKVSGNIFSSYVKETSKGTASYYKHLFQQAGLKPHNAPVIAFFAKLFFAFAFFIGAAIISLNTPMINNQTILKFGVLILGGLLGAQFFDYYLKYRMSSRYKKIRKDLSGSLDLLVVCTNAGLTIENSFEQVAQEVGRYNTDLGKEFAMASIELSVLPNRRQAFENLYHRVDTPLIRGLATTLIQSEEQGTSVSQTLKILAQEFREKNILEAEAKAARLPALLAIPVVLFTLPSLLIVILGPAIVRISDSFNL